MPSADQLCHTADEAFNAGWDDGADDAPLTDSEIARLVVLHAPHLAERDSGDRSAA